MAAKLATRGRIADPTEVAVPVIETAATAPEAIPDSASELIAEVVHATVVAAAPPPELPIPDLIAAPAQAVADLPLPKSNQKQESIMSTAEDLMAFSQGNVEALMKSSQIWATGMQDLGKHLGATAKEQFDSSMSTWKTLSGVKSLKEAMDIQSGLARESLEKAVTETNKLTDASMKLAEQAMAPITARISLATEKFGRAPAL